jgi:hypothetical protein
MFQTWCAMSSARCGQRAKAMKKSPGSYGQGNDLLELLGLPRDIFLTNA